MSLTFNFKLLIWSSFWVYKRSKESIFYYFEKSSYLSLLIMLFCNSWWSESMLLLLRGGVYEVLWLETFYYNGSLESFSFFLIIIGLFKREVCVFERKLAVLSDLLSTEILSGRGPLFIPMLATLCLILGLWPLSNIHVLFLYLLDNYP